MNQAQWLFLLLFNVLAVPAVLSLRDGLLFRIVASNAPDFLPQHPCCRHNGCEGLSGTPPTHMSHVLSAVCGTLLDLACPYHATMLGCMATMLGGFETFWFAAVSTLCSLTCAICFAPCDGPPPENHSDDHSIRVWQSARHSAIRLCIVSHVIVKKC